MLLLELMRRQVFQTAVRPHSVVVTAPVFDYDTRLGARAEPFETQTFVAQLAVERFVGAVLPWLSGIDESRIDTLCWQPFKHGTRDELGTVVGAQITWRTVRADQLRQDIDDTLRADRTSDVDGQAFARELIDHRQTLDLLSVSAGVEHKIVAHMKLAVVAGSGRGRLLAIRRRGRRRGSVKPAWRHNRCVRCQPSR